MPLLTNPWSTPAVDLLVVCTGNLCRSPYLAAALQAALPGLTTASAGTDAQRGTTVPTPVLDELSARGIAPLAGGPRRLTKPMVRSARLIVVAANVHRIRVLELENNAVGKTFTVKELARRVAADAVPAGLGVGGLVQLLGAPVPDRGVDHDDDLADPYGLDRPAYARMAVEVDMAVGRLAPVLRESGQ